MLKSIKLNMMNLQRLLVITSVLTLPYNSGYPIHRPMFYKLLEQKRAKTCLIDRETMVQKYTNMLLKEDQVRLPFKPVLDGVVQAINLYNRSKHDKGNLGDGALCPWKWVVNEETKRVPRSLYSAVCIGGDNHQYKIECEPLLVQVQVLERVEEDGTCGTLETAMTTVSVGCIATYQRTAMTNHHPTVILKTNNMLFDVKIDHDDENEL